ncbi:MAG: signal peptidase I, partial [Firmicutes bacterium]|nr:signal peptidase I [Bacillota bacterium]
NKLVYRWHEPERGDVVVFRYPLDPSRDFIKRVIAVGGDYVEIRLGQIYVNGQAIEEPYVANRDLQSYPKTRVPPGSIFVLGDNRRNSEDSRVFGAVELRYVKGKAFLVYWPFSEAQLLTAGR